MNRIVDLCLRPRVLGESSADPAGLMEEVSVDYLRTMNKIVLEAQTKEVRILRPIKRATGHRPIARRNV